MTNNPTSFNYCIYQNKCISRLLSLWPLSLCYISSNYLPLSHKWCNFQNSVFCNTCVCIFLYKFYQKLFSTQVEFSKIMSQNYIISTFVTCLTLIKLELPLCLETSTQNFIKICPVDAK